MILYHWTTKENARLIQIGGLKVSMSKRNGKIFLCRYVDIMDVYSHLRKVKYQKRMGLVLLRVNLGKARLVPNKWRRWFTIPIDIGPAFIDVALETSVLLQ